MRSIKPVSQFWLLLSWSPLLLLWCAMTTTSIAQDQTNRQTLYVYLKGKDIYKRNCVMCHGDRGKGDGEWALQFKKNRPRNFRTGIFKFRTTPFGFLPTDSDLKRTIQRGISGTAMPAFTKMSKTDLDAVIRYIKTFSSKWRDSEQIAPAIPFQNPPKQSPFTPGRLEKAKSVFVTHCAPCHGDDRTGKGPAAENLQDVWGYPIAPADLTQKHFKSGDSPEDLYRTVALGLGGTPMVGFRETLTDQQIWDLVFFIRENP
jgi:cytochrome c oxidase cbb3-type subunit I/II